MKEMSKPLQWMGWLFGGMGALVTAAFVFTMISEGDYSDAPGIIIPLFFVAAGVGLIALGRRAGRDAKFEIGHFVFWVFGAVGAVMMIGGVFLAFDDPAGLILIPFGGVFVAAGWFARKAFVPPEGMKRVAMTEDTGTFRSGFGQTTRVTTGTYIHVAEDATDEEVEKARSRWREDQMKQRPDWLKGRIEQESKRTGGALKYAAIFAFVLTGALGAVGWFADPFFFLMAGFVCVGAVVIAWQAAGQAARARKFGYAEFDMRRHPVAPGERLEGVIETEAPRRELEDGRFLLTLSCKHTTRYRRNDKTHYRTKTIWSEEAHVNASGEMALTVKVRFDIPADLPGATLGRSGGTGYTWELKAEAEAPGVDFVARFELPVIETPKAL